MSPALNGILVIAGVGLLGMNARPAPADLYPLEQTLSPAVDRRLVLHAADGKPFAERGGCVDAPVHRGEVPQHFVDALLAMEDRRFYSHFGLDPKGILRAAVRNFEAGGIAQGGSTITQQLAKIAYLSKVKSFERKLEEALVAVRLELSLTKDEILERYLSTAYFGQGCHGLRAATRHYFDKSVDALSLSESALLVALLPSPSLLSQDWDKARERQRLVLRAMVETGRLSRADMATLEPANLRKASASELGGYYADWIAQTIELPGGGETAPLAVRTSFEPGLQRLAEEAVAKIMDKRGTRGNAGQAALVAMRPDGRVVAMVGGRDYGKSQFNRSFHAMRQPGSAFKTFVYLAALRQGAKPEMTLHDEPISIGDWAPQNYGQSYRGAVSLETAFASSINTVAVRLSETVGRDEVIAAARDLGIRTPLQSIPSIALGTSEVNLVELTSSYAAIAAGAYPLHPWGVVALGDRQDGDGRPPAGSGEWKLAAGEPLKRLLAATVRQGTARSARLPIPAYGKTGTSQDFRDAWFIGFAGNLVVGVWVGNDDNSSMKGITGGNLPAQIWRQFMDQARKADPKFEARPAQVAAFEAKARPLTAGSGRALASLLSEPQVAGWRYESDVIFLDPYDTRMYRHSRRYRSGPSPRSRHMRTIMQGDGGA